MLADRMPSDHADTRKPSTITKKIAFFVYPGFQLLDLSGPMAAFQASNQIEGDIRFDFHLVSATGGPIVSEGGIEVASRKPQGEGFDTLIVVGADTTYLPTRADRELLQLVADLSARARRVASVCTGAFILAELGLLRHRRATTHWKCSSDFVQRFPDVHLDCDQIYTQDGSVWTSAGVSAGIDMALSMLEEDCGDDIARDVAKLLVVYHRRPAHQHQVSTMLDNEPQSNRMRAVMNFIRGHLTEDLTNETLADVACLSPRQFVRVFQAETGETPFKMVETLRLEGARDFVVNGNQPFAGIARDFGFVTPDRMRRAFVRNYGKSPSDFRQINHA